MANYRYLILIDGQIPSQTLHDERKLEPVTIHYGDIIALIHMVNDMET